MKNNIHTLIFPDIHGRTFWKETLNKFPINEYPNLKIIFLGDYLDPYEFEYISKQDAILNFEDIIKTTKSDNRITLLLGNHDYHYKTYLYTHAGVTSHWLNHLRFLGNICLNNNHISEEQKEWIKEHLYEFELTADNLNALLYNFQGMAILHEVSYERGGDFQNGSCIWADIVEHLYDENKNEYINNIFQIFGHSLRYPSIDEGYIDYDNNYAMLDSRNSWVLYNNGKLETQN